jgi:hypothetical protein
MKLQLVPPRTGLVWIRAGMRTFWRQPLALAGLFFMFMGLVSLLSRIPLLGNLLALTLMPSATLGLMVAARQADEGRFPMPSVLASAFAAGRQRMQAMLVLGALYALGLLLLMGLTALLDGGTFAQVYLGNGQVEKEALESPEFQQAALLGMALYTPLSVMFWHAPALVHWHGITPVKSLFFSATACWMNKGAMLVYAGGWFGVFVVAGLFMSVLGATVGGSVAPLLLMPAVMLMASMFFASIFFTFRDSFSAHDTDTPQP